MSSSAIKRPKIVETLTLEHPVEEGHDKIEELEFEALKAKHLKGLPPFKVDKDEGYEMSFDFLIGLVRNVTNQSTHVIDELEASDFFKASEIVCGFLEDSPLNMQMPLAS